MKKLWKKLLAVTLAASMTMSMVSITSLAAEEENEENGIETYSSDVNQLIQEYIDGVAKVPNPITRENMAEAKAQIEKCLALEEVLYDYDEFYEDNVAMDAFDNLFIIQKNYEELVKQYGEPGNGNETGDESEFDDVDAVIEEYIGLARQIPEEITKDNMAEIKPVLDRYREIQLYIDENPSSALADAFYDGDLAGEAYDAFLALEEASQKYDKLIEEMGEPEDPDPDDPTPVTPAILAEDEGITVTLEDGVFTVTGTGRFSGYITVNGIRDTVANYGKEKIASVVIENVTVGNGVFRDIGCLTSLTATNATIDNDAFKGAFADNATVTLTNCTTIGSEAFANNPGIAVTLDGCTMSSSQFDGSMLTSLAVSNMELAVTLFADCTINGEVNLSTVTAVRKAAFDNTEGDFVLTNVPDNIVLEHSHSFNVNSVDGLNERILKILADQFDMLTPKEARAIAPQGWTSAKEGKANEVTSLSTQITEEAKWNDDDRTIADVLFQAYCTDVRQMDFVFVMDSSNSMGDRGTADALNARFYELQSKLADVAGQLLNSGDEYDCRVAVAGFGGDNYYMPRWGEGFVYEPGGRFATEFFDNAADAQNAIMNATVYDEWTNFDIGLNLALELVEANKAAGRSTTVILITDGKPQKCDNDVYTDPNTGEQYFAPAEYVKTFEQVSGIAEADAIKAAGAQIFGVLQSVPADQLGDAKAVMENICTAGKYFLGSDLDEFSDAVNSAIYQSMKNYTVSWQVNPDFALDETALNPSEGTSVEVAHDEAGNTFVTWTLSGQTYELQTLGYQLKLKDELANRYGTYNYEMNLGNADLAAAGAVVNTVETPILSRTLERPTDPDPDTYTLTIRYVYADGTTARPTVTRRNLEQGDRYSVTSPEIEGYEADILVVEGTMPARNVTVTVTYTAVEDVEETQTPTTETPEVTETPDPVETQEPDETQPPETEEPEEVEELGETDTPLTEAPEETEELGEGETPLAEVPQTGDLLWLWILLAVTSAAGLIWISLEEKKGKRVA